MTSFLPRKHFSVETPVIEFPRIVHRNPPEQLLLSPGEETKQCLKTRFAREQVMLGVARRLQPIPKLKKPQLLVRGAALAAWPLIAKRNANASSTGTTRRMAAIVSTGDWSGQLQRELRLGRGVQRVL